MTLPGLAIMAACMLALAIASLTLNRWLQTIPDRGASGHGGQVSIAQINALLPQTQCGQCGYPGCRPYAEAIAHGVAINRCPPGGAATITRLARLLQQPEQPLDPRHGAETSRKVAFIREAECIGCTKCIQACPVDAIIGAPKRMHTVIVRDCTGCDLCVAPCPVDCIDMLPAPVAGQPLTWRPS